MEKDLDDQVSVKMENGQSGGKTDSGGEYSKNILISVAIQPSSSLLCDKCPANDKYPEGDSWSLNIFYFLARLVHIGVNLLAGITSGNIAAGCEEGPGICAHLLTAVSLLLVVVSLPLSLLLVVKVVQVIEIFLPLFSNFLIQGV